MGPVLNSFGTCSLRLSEARESPKQKINVRGEKGKAAGNILSKRKGGIISPVQGASVYSPHGPRNGQILSESKFQH